MVSKKILIARPIRGITINGLEYLHDEQGELVKFDTVEEAKTFLFDKGMPWMLIHNNEQFIFEEVEVEYEND